MFQTKGMNTYMDQEKDRNAWAASMAKRKSLIDQLKAMGRCPRRPEELKLKTLELLAQG